MAVRHDGSKPQAPQRATHPAPAVRVDFSARRQRASAPASLDALLELLWDAYWTHPSDDNRNLLVETYQHLVPGIVHRFSARLPRAVDRGDLLTAANVGLMTAIESFDPERGVPFELYCYARIRGALMDELRHLDWLPRSWRQRIEQHKHKREELRGSLGREPGAEELAQALHLSLDEYQTMFGTGLPGVQGNGTAEDLGESLLDVVADPRLDGPEERLGREELLRLVSQKLSQLEYRIVYLKYWEELSMKEIGQLLSLSESRVCRAHSRLIERLQERFKSSNLAAG